MVAAIVAPVRHVELKVDYHHPAAYASKSLSLVSGPAAPFKSRQQQNKLISGTGHARNALFIHFKCRLAHRDAAISSQLGRQLSVLGCLTQKHLNTEPGPSNLWGGGDEEHRTLIYRCFRFSGG